MSFLLNPNRLFLSLAFFSSSIALFGSFLARCSDADVASQQTQDESDKKPDSIESILLREQEVVEAIAVAEKSVVSIARVGKSEISDPSDPRFVPEQYGTGVVLKSEGMLLTNYHVLGDPELYNYFVWVQKADSDSIEILQVEKIVAADPWTDLAVLKVRAGDLVPIRFGDTSGLRRGQFVISLGNPYAIARDGQPSASCGIISNLERRARTNATNSNSDEDANSIHAFGTLIHTDARLEYGTSGGALVNLKGEMIGLTTSYSAIKRFDTPAGFAIPTDALFQRTVESLVNGERIEYGFLGVSPRDLAASKKGEGRRGVAVAQVVEGTPAYLAGIRFGDTITHLNGMQVENSNEFRREMGKHLAGATILVNIQRDRIGVEELQELRLNVKLSKRYLDSTHPSLPARQESNWRGLEVDYATAIPRFSERSRFVNPDGCVAIVRVQRNSAAWDAGLRPREFVSHVDGVPVKSPSEFYRLVNRSIGKSVKLTVSGDGKTPDSEREIPANAGN